jgi:HAD superfamily 5'-nucleotidase-like hydrolase
MTGLYRIPRYNPCPMVSALDPDAQLAALLSDAQTELDVPRRHRVFCNRNIRMDSIELLGFDMDYTLALYHQDKLEELSIRLTLQKLVEHRGYSPEVLELAYDPARAIRGLMVDKRRGNVFKMDRHSHVGRCFHGTRKLPRDERRGLYRGEKLNFASDAYAWIDTLFGLPEAVMYMSLVDWMDRAAGRPADDYTQLFEDIRAAIDEAHRDDTLKSVIKADLAGYIQKDPNLAETLHKLRSSGKKLFLLTNSLFDYTDAVMRYLLDGERGAYPSWRHYFDVVIVGGAKPAFFNERRPFLLVDPLTGQPGAAPVERLAQGRVYQGGNVFDFEAMTGIEGDHVLYVGDHIYGDIVRLRKQRTWRTAMVLQELEREIAVGDRLDAQVGDLDLLDRRRRNLESEIDYQALRLKKLKAVLDEDGDPADPARARLEEARRTTKRQLESLRDRLALMTEEVGSLEEMIERSYNPYWGSVLREGNENSRFGEQLSDYADLYTSKVSNFLSYSPLRYFRAPRRTMPHDL